MNVGSIRFLMIVAIVLIGSALSGCELNQGVDFLTMKQTPASSSVVECGGHMPPMNLGWFDQPFGRFTGTITGDDDAVYEIETMLGVIEEHYAKW